MTHTPPAPADERLAARTRAIFDEQRQALFCRTDRMFAVLMILQWTGGTLLAMILSPESWWGSQRVIHPHVWLALVFGGALCSLPVYMATHCPGSRVTRHLIAVTQMVFSSLLIHVTGGRMETHFHIFGSLAFLAFYREWILLVPATLLVAADHYVRGTYWPQTLFGAGAVGEWRWVEHTAWIVFEDIFLFISCHFGVQEMRANARRTAELERTNADVQARTLELESAYESKNAILETALDAVIGMDSAGRVISWNSQAAATFGWSQVDVLGRPLTELIVPPSQRGSTVIGFRSCESGSDSAVLNRRIEVTALRRDGREFPVEVAVAPYRAGDSLSYCAFIRDITERQQSAEQLRRAKDAAEAANEAKSRFLAHMSHEIRTPLNGILGFAELLQTNADIGEVERREHLQTISDSGQHLLGLINDILDLSKIESGQMEVERVDCAPHDVVAEVVSIHRVRAKMKGIDLEYHWDGPIPESVRTDPARFRQLLMNLIGNAIKFTEIGGVRVAARIVRGQKSHQLAVDVIDTGMGIAAEHLERIFNPFVQADESITRRFGGTGLGLAISRQTAELLGGELKVVSTPGRGSTFTATIDPGDLRHVPMRDASHAADLVVRRPAAGDVARSLAGRSVLLVEDGETNRKLIGLLLRRAGAEVVMAENGRIGVDRAVERPFDLILMDMQMPVLDGYSAAQELRRRRLSVPIIALTAHAMKGDEQRCLDAGCSGYLTKPIDAERLLRTVTEALNAPSPEATSAPIVDVNDCGPLVSRLAADDPELCDLVDEFIVRLPQWLEGMQTAAGCGDYSELARLAHCLRGAGGTAGFDAFTEPAAALEAAATVSDEPGARTSISRLIRLAERITNPAAAC